MAHNSILPALLASRICHDLISPIGAIGNGLELLVMAGGGGKGPELALITDSVTQANARIRFYRVAFGISSPGQRMGRAEVHSILSDLTQGSRLRMDWHSPEEVPRREAKIAFLLLMCLESALPFGGRVTVTATPGTDDAMGWQITAQALKVRIDPDVWRMLEGADAPASLGPGHVQFALAAAEARLQGRAITAVADAQDLSLSF